MIKELPNLYSERLEKIKKFLLSESDNLTNQIKLLINDYNLLIGNDGLINLCFEVFGTGYGGNYSLGCNILDINYDYVEWRSIFNGIPEEDLEFDEIDQNPLIDYEFELINLLEDFIYYWFVKCWQEAEGFEIKNRAYVHHYYVQHHALSLFDLKWGDIIDETPMEISFSVSKLTDEDIEESTKIPDKEKIYSRYFEDGYLNPNYFYELTIKSKKLIIRMGEINKSEDIQIQSFSNFYSALEKINELIINMRIEGFVGKKSPDFLKPLEFDKLIK